MTSILVRMFREKFCKAQCRQAPPSGTCLEFSRMNGWPVSRGPDGFQGITSIIVNEVMTPWLVSARIFLKKCLIPKTATLL
jgi:hypothetical protein